MKIDVTERQPGHIPLGALVMLPMFLMPIGGWLVEQGWVNFGKCAMKSTFGIPCMTCGSTRATLRLLHGDVLGAIAYQPMMMAVYLLVVLWGLTSLVLFAQNKRVKIRLSRTEDRIFKAVLIVVPLVNWAYLIAMGI